MKISEVCYFVENASAGATSSASISTAPNAGKKKNKSKYNKDGTIKNAIDMPDNIFSGSLIKRTKNNDNKKN